MNALVKLFLMLAASSVLSACGWLMGDDGVFRDRGNDYRQAKLDQPLALPESIDTDAINDNYAIPQISDRASLSEEFVLPRPEPLESDVERDSVRINTLAGNRWILVNGSPGQIWPRLRGFLNLNQMTVQRADATQGILETVWMQPQGEGLLKERFQIRVDQGVQRATTEVFVTQADIRAGTESWPAQSSSDEREKIMVSSLAQYLADSAAAAAVSMLAQQAIDSSGRVTLEETDAGQVFLALQLPYARAWASVSRALEKSGFVIDDRDRSEKVFYTHYAPEQDEDEGGFFSRLFSNSKEQEEGTAYFVKLNEPSSSGIHISIERQSGEAMASGEAAKLLKTIKRHLS